MQKTFIKNVIGNNHRLKTEPCLHSNLFILILSFLGWLKTIA